MKRLSIHALAAVSGFVCLVSCSGLESEFPSDDQSSTHQLRIVTQTREGDDPIATVYVFKSDNTFVNTLQTDADDAYTTASASAKLLAGSYNLYAYGGELSHFQFPDLASITPTSAITLADNQAMGDLLMATATTNDISDGDAETVNMTLERKVLELSSVTISRVPEDVTEATVSIAPFYSAILINGTYVDTDPVTATFTLTETATAGVWQATTPQLVFPSISAPTITVTFTRGESGARTYTYSELSDALTANNKYDISGNYTEPLGVTISGTITSQAWPTTSTDVPFGFNEDNANTSTDPSTGTDDPSSGSGGSETSNPPVAGQQYKGCYVVSVDTDAKTAVLLSPTEGTGYDVEGYNATDWLNCLNSVLLTWPSVEGVTGTWRIPTLEEITLFAQPAGIVSNIEQGKDKYFFCIENTALKIVRIINAAGTASVKSTSTGFKSEDYLRPVIDINY